MAKDFQNLAKVTASFGKSGHTGHQTSRYSLVPHLKFNQDSIDQLIDEFAQTH